MTLNDSFSSCKMFPPFLAGRGTQRLKSKRSQTDSVYLTVLVGIVGETRKVAFALTTLQDEEVQDGHLWSRKEQAGRRNSLSKSQR